MINTYFLEHRAKLLDIAAFLDRLDRAAPETETPDFRQQAMLQAIAILSDGQPQRAKRILDLLSDHSSDLPQSAMGMKGATGAVRLSGDDLDSPATVPPCSTTSPESDAS